jgi:two-component system sensor histidine kinase KdpD
MSTADRPKYLGFVAHEIKNPLATALWSCDLLKRLEPAERGSERAEKMIDVSLRALRRMRRLIDDFFTLERLEQGGYELRRERLPLRELVESSVQMLAEKDGIATQGWTVEAQGEVQGDGALLKRAVRALLEYLARASPEPRLRVSSRKAAGGHELLVVADAPPSPLVPPPPEERQAGDPQGAVLGFALAARVLEWHGGRIEPREGGFSLFFPES